MKTKNSVSKLMLVASLSFIISLSVNAQSKSVLSSYLDIKNALVITDSKAANSAAKDLVDLLEGKGDDLSGKIKSDAVEISSTSDVKVQRKHFHALSENVYQLVKASNEKDGPIYKQYCPMAFNNTGAFWLAAEKEINNPYLEVGCCIVGL